MNNFLEEIVAHKRKVIAQYQPVYDSFKNKLCEIELTRYGVFKRKLKEAKSISLIAEIKKASPSQGVIRDDFDVLKIAKTYVEHNAAAISVLTEDKYFLGKPDYVKKVSENYSLPVLTKDFILDEGQIYEAHTNGASAVLLIVAILNDDELKQLIEVSQSLDLDALVEVHDEKELERALKSGAEIIGVNNRDLTTFDVTLETAKQLIPQIPNDKIVVAESGIQTSDDVKMLEELGAKAVLIGETFMRAKDIGAKIDEVMKK